MSYSLIRRVWCVFVVAAVAVAASCRAGVAQPAGDPPVSGKRGPGLKGPDTSFLKLPVPRTFDLAHVEAEHFAAALGKDPEKIFAFVRDHIAYETYPGCLRGPRGTLLAMAGNSVDRAALLSAMLQAAGHKTRFARGDLPRDLAKELVGSMAERSAPAAVKAPGDASPELSKAVDAFLAGVKRDYTAIREQLKKRDKAPTSTPPTSMDDLIGEATSHYWVQWHKDGKWVDLDPVRSDATLGQAYAAVKETFASLPNDLFHRVAIRIRVEEYSVLLQGKAATKPEERIVLKTEMKAADLSGIDVVLTHQPENWKEPAEQLQSALAAAITNTGRIKPVLFIANKTWVAGEAFRPRLPAGKGLGGVGGLLGGDGTRRPVAIATAATLEFDFVSPGGRTKTLRREIFDLVGPDKRDKQTKLTAEDVRALSRSDQQPELHDAIYSLFFTTGRIDARQMPVRKQEPPAPAPPPAEKHTPVEITEALRGFHVGFLACSDSLDRGLAQRRILVYPDSPRVQIAQVDHVSGRARFSFDLRSDQVRVLPMSTDAEAAFYSRVFRGVFEGGLERFWVEQLLHAPAEKKDLGPIVSTIVSTSLLCERARAQGVGLLLLPADKAKLDSRIPADSLARLRGQLRDGNLAVALQRPITIDKQPRYAWWLIDPRTGETIAVTDSGLHGAAPERTFVTHKVRNKVQIIAMTASSTSIWIFDRFVYGQQIGFWEKIQELLDKGYKYLGPVP